MNILYLSHLSGALYAGPSYSVPKQIEAQAILDNVFWYNAIRDSPEKWKSFSYYHDLNGYPSELIRKLPAPFNTPDLIVVELFYNMARSKMLHELLSGKYRFIIVPRGELTKQAQRRKHLKKWIVNKIAFKKFANKAIAIQYLTKQEYLDSGNLWNNNNLIIPNGIDIPHKSKASFSKSGIKCISIGRIEPYQKGLDLLIEVCSRIKVELQTANCSIVICGPDKENKLDDLKKQVSIRGLSSIISFHDGVYGDEKEKMLLESDVFIFPSRFEGHPMGLIEALSYGLPCIATAGSNMKNKIDEYRAGWTSGTSVEDLKIAMLKMLEEKEKMNIFGENAKNLALEFDWDRIAGESHLEYSNCIKMEIINGKR